MGLTCTLARQMSKLTHLSSLSCFLPLPLQPPAPAGHHIALPPPKLPTFLLWEPLLSLQSMLTTGCCLRRKADLVVPSHLSESQHHRSPFPWFTCLPQYPAPQVEIEDTYLLLILILFAGFRHTRFSLKVSVSASLCLYLYICEHQG